MRRSSATKLGALAFVIAAAAVVVWKHPWSSGGGPDLKFDTVAVDKGPIAAKVSATGTLSPRKTVQVGAQVSGRITELHADFNDHVTKDQVIARLDPQIVQAQIVQTRATLTAARANVAKAKVALDDAHRQRARTDTLKEQNLVSAQSAEAAQTTEDSARASLAAAQAQVAQAQATVEQAELNLTYTTIKSPIDGVVIARAVDVGQTVAASLQAPTLFTIAEDLSHMQIDTSVAEGDVGRLTEKMKARFTVDAFPGRTFDGVVRQVRNAPTTVSGVVTYDAVIDVDNTDGALRPGMTANVTFVLDEVASAVRIPNAALRFKPTPAQRAALFGGDGGGRSSGQRGAGGSGGRRRGGGGSDASAGSGAGSSAGGDRGGGDRSDADPTRKTVWKLDNGKAHPVRVKVGLTDGSRTQLVEGELQPGDQLITTISGAPPSSAPGAGGPMRF
jgi:HlyD family secretion protein